MRRKKAQALLKVPKTEGRAAVICWFPQLGCFKYRKLHEGGSNPGALSPAVEETAVRESAAAAVSLSSLFSSSCSLPCSYTQEWHQHSWLHYSPRCVLIRELSCVWKGKKYLNSTE